MASRTKGLSVTNGTKIIFDTSAVIKLLDQQCNLVSLGINIDEAQLLTSVIVRMELLAKRNISVDEEQDIKEFLEDLIIVPIDDAIEQIAI